MSAEGPQSPKIVTRFAPSPTGYLHVGGARTALFSWLVARHAGANGRFLLRIEDTDLARSTEQAARQLLDDLRWLGLQWDNAEPVYQSKRLDVYNPIIEDMIARGLAYKSWETREEEDALRKEAEKAKRTYKFKRSPLTDAQIKQFESDGRPHVVRFAMPVKDVRFDDAIVGPDQGVSAAEVQDFVIRKSDGMPTFHFAVVVDDAALGVTHVLRGQEHLLNTVNHVALQDALGYPRPVFAHLPVILNAADGSKMGKRDRDKKVRERSLMWMKNAKKTPVDLATASSLDAGRVDQWLKDTQKQLDLAEHDAVMGVIGMKENELPEILVHDFRTAGYLPEALLNFLALLGWNPGGDRERMSIADMVSLFDLKDVGKSNAKFDRAKLLDFNTKAAGDADPASLVPTFRQYLASNPASPLNRASDADLATMLAMKKGFRLLRDVDEASRFLFMPDEDIQLDPAAVEKVLKKGDGEGLGVLRELLPALQALPEWTAATIELAVNAFGESKGLGLGKIAQPIRVAVSGGTISPPIFDSLHFLGRDKTLNRIARCIATASA